MWLYLDGSESGLRPQQLPLEDNDLTLIDLTESWAAFVPDDYAKPIETGESASPSSHAIRYTRAPLQYCLHNAALRSLQT